MQVPGPCMSPLGTTRLLTPQFCHSGAHLCDCNKKQVADQHDLLVGTQAWTRWERGSHTSYLHGEDGHAGSCVLRPGRLEGR